MWHSLVAAVVLAAGAAQDGGLEIVHPRATYGHLGAPRPKEALLPGDVAHFTFDVRNLKLDAAGKASYSLAIEVRDAADRVVFQQQPYNAVAQNLFGGTTLPCSGRVEVPLDLKPGPVHWKVTVTDRAAGTTATLAGKGQVQPPGFGLVRVGTFADPEARFAVPPVGVVGEPLYVAFSAVGFGRTQDSKQPDLHVALRVLDEKGQPTRETGLTGAVTKDVPADERLVPMQFGLTLTRPGRFTLELTARDAVTGKTARVALPIRVVETD